VITVVLNGAATLSRTIGSIREQDYAQLQYILVDGGSTDGTLDIVERNRDQIDVLVSGPDSGIAQAMNNGLVRASGDLVLFLHAEDRFVSPEALSRAMAQVSDLDHIWACDILFGTGEDQVRASPRPFNWWAWFKNPLPHQGVLCPRRLFGRLGGFDESLRIDMDYDFWLRAYRAGTPLARVDLVLTVMGDSGVSSRRDWQGLRARFAEERRVQLRNTREKGWRWVFALYWPLYLGYRRVRAAVGI
jgi:glycosyltransferase involved in cell wall biosynthesis